jgi:hypothetical protein
MQAAYTIFLILILRAANKVNNVDKFATRDRMTCARDA